MNDKLEQLKKEKLEECETCACHGSKWCDGYVKALEASDKALPQTVQVDADLNILERPPYYSCFEDNSYLNRPQLINYELCKAYQDAREITLFELAKELRKKLEQTKQQEGWISVEERLPDCHSQHGTNYGSGYVFTLDSDGEADTGQYWKVHKDTEKGHEFLYEHWEGYEHKDLDTEVTHWMPIPLN